MKKRKKKGREEGRRKERRGREKGKKRKEKKGREKEKEIKEKKQSGESNCGNIWRNVIRSHFFGKHRSGLRQNRPNEVGFKELVGC